MTNIRIHQRGPAEQRTLAILRDCLLSTCSLHWPHQVQHAAVLWQQSKPTHNPASSAGGSCSHVASCWAQSNDELLSESTCRHQGTSSNCYTQPIHQSCCCAHKDNKNTAHRCCQCSRTHPSFSPGEDPVEKALRLRGTSLNNYPAYVSPSHEPQQPMLRKSSPGMPLTGRG